MIRWFKSLFAWKMISFTGVWTYSQNTVTGQRKAEWSGCGYQPLRHNFLHVGDIVHGPRGRYVVGTDGEMLFG